MPKLTMTMGAAILTAAMVSAATPPKTTAAEKTAMTATDYRRFPFITITGDTTSLEAYQGKVVLIVNTASKCGYTKQYAGLEALYLAKKDKGLVILGFPANNFGGQEPGTNEEIANFCQTKFDVTFPMMAKVSVKGADKHPLFAYLTEKSPQPGEIEWNFTKFLLDKNGNLVARYKSPVAPDNPELVGKIDELLGKK